MDQETETRKINIWLIWIQVLITFSFLISVKWLNSWRSALKHFDGVTMYRQDLSVFIGWSNSWPYYSLCWTQFCLCSVDHRSNFSLDANSSNFILSALFVCFFWDAFCYDFRIPITYIADLMGVAASATVSSRDMMTESMCVSWVRSN